MATIKQVYQMMREGKTAPEMLSELKITPGRLRQIIGSKMIWKMDLLQRDIVPLVAKMVALGDGLHTTKRLKDLSARNDELGRKACQSLLENLNDNFPPERRVLRSRSRWDRD